jgi:membrane protein
MEYLEYLQKQIIDFIWIKEVRAYPKWKQSLVQALRIGYLVIRDLVDGQLTLRAMGLVYTTLLSLVPFIAISFSVLKGFGVHNQIEPMLLNFLAPLEERGVEITNRILEFVNNMKAGVLGSVGLVLLLYTAVSLLQKIERSFNYMWHVTEGRPFAQRFSEYISVILIGPVLIFTALGITASIASIALIQQLMEIEALGIIFEALSVFIPYLLIIVAFTFVYMLVPNTKVYFKSALVGGMVAGVMWQSAGWIFASFVVSSTKYMAIYTVFASLIFFMIWLYVSWLILLIGCGISFYFQHPEHRRLHSRAIDLSNRLKEKLSIAIMALVGKLFYEKSPPCNAQQLATQLGIGVEACNKVINVLLEANLLIKTSDESPTLLPAYALDVMLLKDVVNAARTNGESASLNPLSMVSQAKVQHAYERLENGMQSALGDCTVKDLLDTGTMSVNGPTNDANTNAYDEVDANNVRELNKS